MEMKSLLVNSIFKSFVPLFVGGSYRLLKEILSNYSLWESNLNLYDGDDDGNKRSGHVDTLKAAEELSSDFVTVLNEIGFGIYENFFAFLVAMLLIDMMCKIAQNGFQEFCREAKASIISQIKSPKKSERKWKLFKKVFGNQMAMRIFCYILIFISLQIVGCCLPFARNDSLTEVMGDSQGMMMMNIQPQEDYFGFPRILSQEEGEETQHNEHLSSDKISLSMRNVLSSLNINVNAMVLSKDRKIAYATLNIYGTLKIIDISDLKAPFILGSLNLKNSVVAFRIKSLALSSDEKILYASNSRELEIIDVTDPGSPRLISLTPSEIFSDRNWKELSEYFRTSLAISEKTKTLYIAGQGLQVYDVSDPTRPVLLKAVKNERTQKDNESTFRNELLRNEICLSRDEQILFMANGTLDIFNVSNPKDMQKLNSFTMGGNPRSLLLSEDERTVFLLGSSVETKEIIFEEVEISNYSSPPSVRSLVRLGRTSTNSPRFLTASPNKSKFFIFANTRIYDQGIDLLVFDRIKQTTTQIEKSLMEETFAMIFSSGGRTLIACSNNQFLAIELYLDYPNSKIFSEYLENQVATVSLPSFCFDHWISNDEETLFVLRRNEKLESSYSRTFEVWDISNASASKVLSSYISDGLISRVYFTKNYETAYLLGDMTIHMLDISNKFSVAQKRIFEVQGKVLDFAISSDEKTGFLLMNKGGKGLLTLMDLSQATGIKSIATLDQEFATHQTFLILKDDTTLIVLDEQIFIYDISNLYSPAEIASIPYGINETKPAIDSFALSPDKNALFIVTSDKNYFSKLGIYNISSIKSPHLISEKYFSRSEDDRRKPKFLYPLYSNNGFLYQSNSLIKLNMTDLKKPMISGLIHFEDGQIWTYVVSPDGQTIYTSVGNKIQILNMNIKYTLYLNKEKYLLGGKYSNKVLMLRLNGKSDYDLMDPKSYRIIKLSLLDIQIAPNKVSLEKTISPLPYWMSFDMHSQKLTLEPKKQSELGAYTLHSAFSLKIPRDVFNNSRIGTPGKPVISEDLIAWLVSLGYIDNQLFLTENFGSLETFLLPAQFLDYKEQIYNILKGFYIETCTMFEVTGSLEFKESDLMISSFSTNNIHVEITLEPRGGSEAKLVNVPYGGLLPVIRENKTKVVLEGTINEINTALKSVVVNFENGTLSDATVVIKDGLNPQVSVEIFNISRYFRINNPPKLNHKSDQTLQEQIDIADIQTGKYFTFTLSSDIFEDEFAENLSHEMGIIKNDTAFPSWLSFSGLTLKGTPPEEIFGRELDLVLIAKNEFKESRVPFKLHIKVSAVFCFKLLLRYSPYILTIVGLLVSANKIFNILAKRRYKHPKEFEINVGEEISPEVIFPVAFIQEEKTQSRLILKLFKKTVHDFIENGAGVLDKQRILDEIKEVIQVMPSNERKKITRYPSPIIDHIIVNQFILKQLDSEKQTKCLFEELKSNCLEIVERDPSFGFTINQNKLRKILTSSEDNSKDSEDLEENLIPYSEGINLELLQDAILAYAFECHSLDISPVKVNIGIKQQVPSRFLFNFLKLNLKDISFNHENKIDYGINYRIIDDKLVFYGKVQSYFEGKTLAIQIKNNHQKILKEIWIHGVQRGLTEYEQENIGQSYEVY